MFLVNTNFYFGVFVCLFVKKSIYVTVEYYIYFLLFLFFLSSVFLVLFSFQETHEKTNKQKIVHIYRNRTANIPMILKLSTKRKKKLEKENKEKQNEGKKNFSLYFRTFSFQFISFHIHTFTFRIFAVIVRNKL